MAGDIEAKTDNMADEFLIDSREYKAFVDIGRFTNSQNVRAYIVHGHLMKEKLIPWKARP